MIKAVALDLFHYLESFASGPASDTISLPMAALGQWYDRFLAKFNRKSDKYLYQIARIKF